MSRSRILTHERFARTAAPDPAQRELNAIREILHAYLQADRPEEAFQFALDRVTPLIGASFASIYLVDGVSELMRLAAAFNWPAKFRPWLGEMRVRVGFGPSGEAVTERRLIEVPDVTTDRSLEDWAEVAAELGFRSLVALPLQNGAGALGTVTFYFAEAGTATQERRNLMRLLADQIAAIAEKVRIADELRRTSAALSDTNAELERQYAAVLEARRGRDEFLANASEDLRGPLTALLAALDAHEDGPRLDVARRSAADLLWRIDELLEYAALRAGPGPIDLESFSPWEPIGAARRLLDAQGMAVHVLAETGPEDAPRLRSDRRKTARLLASLLVSAARTHSQEPVRVSVEAGNDHVAYRVVTAGAAGVRELEALLQEYRSIEGRAGGTGLGVPLAIHLAHTLGGSVEVEGGSDSVTYVVRLPLEAPTN
ncbi:MAG: GAF domain-containing sensor histidine kinase [Gemmatimonadaceae bacterium]|nr:GAF domain-containing sensor histidine kinase [Gemmatimonadaceae bacterium]